MPSTIRICFTPSVRFADGRWVPIALRPICREFPLYTDGPRDPWGPDSLDRSRTDLFRHFDGATVGPALRDLARTVAVLRHLDAVENADVRTRLQELVAESARELAAAALPDGELTFEAGAVEDFRPVDGPVPVG